MSAATLKATPEGVFVCSSQAGFVEAPIQPFPKFSKARAPHCKQGAVDMPLRSAHSDALQVLKLPSGRQISRQRVYGITLTRLSVNVFQWERTCRQVDKR
jgi:hypothetical protein